MSTTAEETTAEQTTTGQDGLTSQNGTEQVTAPENTPETKPETSLSQETNEYFGAPEEYNYKDINLPEGFRVDDSLANKFSPIAKKLNLSQQSVNELANFFVEYQQEKISGADEKIAEFRKQELETAKLTYEKMLNTDKEIGGGDRTKMNAYIDVADVGYNSFASTELKELIHSLNLDYHPAVIKHFHRLGKLCGNDNVMTTSNKPAGTQQDTADLIYGHSEKQEG